jgi:hypothetical protein
MFKGTVSRDFLPSIFLSNNPPLGSWFTGWSCFAYGLVFYRENRFENRQIWITRCQLHRGIGLFCQSSPLIFTFSSSYSICVWCLPIYFFWNGFPLKWMRANNRFLRRVPRCPNSLSHWYRGIRYHGLIETAGSDPAVSMRLRNLLHKCPHRILLKPRDPIPRSHGDRGIRTLQRDTVHLK